MSESSSSTPEKEALQAAWILAKDQFGHIDFEDYSLGEICEDIAETMVDFAKTQNAALLKSHNHLQDLLKDLQPTILEAYAALPMAKHNRDLIQELKVADSKIRAGLAKAREIINGK